MSAAPAFSLVDGGPMCRLMRRLGWTRPDGRIDYLRAAIVLVAVTWGPLLLATLSARLATGHAFAIDWGVHTRLLAAIPLLLRAEAALGARTRSTLNHLVAEHWVTDQVHRFDGFIAAARRLRDAAAPEVLLLGFAVVASQIVVWNLGAMPFFGRRVSLDSQLIAARYWYAFVALPLFQFLVYRALWRWAIWTQLLWRISRLKLKPVATHPDRSGGLGFLSRPSVGFAYVVAALSAAQSGVWADQVLHGGVAIGSLKLNAGVFLAATLVLALGPLLFMAGHLWRCHYEGDLQYAGLATDYTRQFHARWIERHERDDLLGSADIQSLADLANSFEVVERMRTVPFGNRTIVLIAAAALLPMLPVAMLRVPIPALLLKVGGALLGKPG